MTGSRWLSLWHLPHIPSFFYEIYLRETAYQQQENGHMNDISQVTADISKAIGTKLDIYM